MELSNDISVLKDLVIALLAKVEVLESEHAALRAENTDLRSRLNLNSKNSHKPPSSDGLSKKPGLPKEPPKKSGGQFGHKGRTLKMVDKPDDTKVHHAPYCPCCARIFSPADVVDVAQKRQVFDIPAPRMEVLEHQIGAVTHHPRGRVTKQILDLLAFAEAYIIRCGCLFLEGHIQNIYFFANNRVTSAFISAGRLAFMEIMRPCSSTSR
jgi:Family of unknown function (DUF6444)